MENKRISYGLRINDEDFDVIPPLPTEELRGGITAQKKTPNSTLEVYVDQDTGKAYAERPRTDKALVIPGGFVDAEVTGKRFLELSETKADKSMIGSPLTAQYASEMTSTNKIYVYVGEEPEYESGHWYYHKGDSWVSGGIYNSTAFETDNSLRRNGMAADAKTTGDNIFYRKNSYYSLISVESLETVLNIGTDIKKGETIRYGVLKDSSISSITIHISSGGQVTEILNNILVTDEDSFFDYVVEPEEGTITIPKGVLVYIPYSKGNVQDLKDELDKVNKIQFKVGKEEIELPDMEDFRLLSDKIDTCKEGLDEVNLKSLSEETEAFDITDVLTMNGYLDKSGVFHPSNTLRKSTDFISAKKGDIFYLYVSQDNNNTYPICIYDKDKNFLRGINLKGQQEYICHRHTLEIEEDCLVRFSTMSGDISLIYKKSISRNKNIFDSIINTIGETEQYYEDKSQEVLSNGIYGKFIDKAGDVLDFTDGFVSDFIEVSEKDHIKAGSFVLYENPVLLLFYKNKKVHSVYGTEPDKYQTVEIDIPPMVKYIRIGSLKIKDGIDFKVLKHKNLVKMLEEKTETSYEIPNSYEEMTFNNLTTGYIDNSGKINSVNGWYTTDFLSLEDYNWFKLVSNYGWNACGYVIFDSNRTVLSYISDPNGNSVKRIELDVSEIKNTYPTASYIRFSGKDILKVYTKKTSKIITEGIEYALNTGNVLYNKKIAFCGDSFTEASNLGTELYDDFIGCYKSFAWRIANRNRMKLYHDGVSGSTMHISNSDNPNEGKPFAYNRYKNVPSDCDYIILQFGLNESSLAESSSTKGTKDSNDVTTMWGSWNTVLRYLITNHPVARIGVIMSDAWMPQSYFNTLKEICEWWGIPLLDLGGDPNVPVMNGGRRPNCGLTLNPEVETLRNNTFYSAEGDAHPNDAGHEWRSTVIENFIRSL